MAERCHWIFLTTYMRIQEWNRWNTELLKQKGTITWGLGNAQSVHILKDNREGSGRIQKDVAGLSLENEIMWLYEHSVSFNWRKCLLYKWRVSDSWILHRTMSYSSEITCYSSRKGKNGPQRCSEIIRNTNSVSTFSDPGRWGFSCSGSRRQGVKPRRIMLTTSDLVESAFLRS